MEEIFRFYDQYGPAKIIHIYQPQHNLKAVLVVDNVAIGTSIGGVRMAADVSTEECFRLARSMTLKNAAAGIPHGGGKSVIYGDPKMDRQEKYLLIRAFANAIRDIKEYVPGPDMGTDEDCMAVIRDEIGRSVGLPREIGGIPLDTIGATGFGVAHATEIAAAFCQLPLEGSRVVIQGFGAVGKHAARFLARHGAILVGASDSVSCIANPAGIDIETLIQLKDAGHNVADYQDGIKGDRSKALEIECDIWIPAARPDVIHADNADKLRTRLVVEGANIPITSEAEEMLRQRGILCIPDFIANAGGVICAAVEYRGGTEHEAMNVIEEKIRYNTSKILELCEQQGISPRQAALNYALEHIDKACSYRRWQIY